MNPLLDFKMCGRLVFGAGAIEELPAAVQGLGAESALIVTDEGLAEAGICGRAERVLADAGIKAETFTGVESDPRMGIVSECTAAAEEFGPDALIGLGGGSSLDIAKMTAVMLVNGGEVTDYLGIDNVPRGGQPTVMMPTTAGTGSEVTPIVVLSDEAEHLKKGVVSDHLYPDVALVDPELALSLPPRITAYTGVDALTHAVESYTNRHAQPFVDTFALEAIRLIGGNLRRAVSCGEDLDARYNMALASLYGGLCLGSVNTTAVHALAYPLGGEFGVPHGVANSLLLPYVMEFNLVSDLEKFTNIAAALGENVEWLSLRDAAALSAGAVKQLCADIGIITRMRDLDVPEDAIDEMAEAAMKVTRLLNNNPRTVTLEDARTIYRNAY